MERNRGENMNKILTREQLFNVADEFRVSRYDTGLIDKITAYKKGNLIHNSQAIYTTVNGLTRLSDIQGFLFPEIWNSLETPQLEWYDRNPSPFTRSYLNALAPHAITQAWTYTVPNNRKAFIESIDLSLVRMVAGAAAERAQVFVQIQPKGATTQTTLLFREIFDNTIGAHAEATTGQSLLLFSGDIIQALTFDNNVGGTVQFFVGLKGTEFDA